MQSHLDTDVIESEIYTRLYVLGITSIVSNRIYPNDPIENSQYPFLVYRTTSANPQITLAGSSNLTKYTVQIDIWAHSTSQASSLEAEITTQLHGYSGGNIAGSFQTNSQAQAVTNFEGDITHRINTYDVWVKS